MDFPAGGSFQAVYLKQGLPGVHLTQVGWRWPSRSCPVGSPETWERVVESNCFQLHTGCKDAYTAFRVGSAKHQKDVCEPSVYEAARVATGWFKESKFCGCPVERCMDQEESAYVFGQCIGPGQPRHPKGK